MHVKALHAGEIHPRMVTVDPTASSSTAVPATRRSDARHRVVVSEYESNLMTNAELSETDYEEVWDRMELYERERDAQASAQSSGRMPAPPIDNGATIAIYPLATRNWVTAKSSLNTENRTLSRSNRPLFAKPHGPM